MKPENPFLLSSLYCLNSRLHKWLFRRSTHNKLAASLARGSCPTGMASSAVVSPWRLCAISAFISFYLISFRTVEFVLSIQSCKLKWFRMGPAYASRLLNRPWLDESQTRVFSKKILLIDTPHPSASISTATGSAFLPPESMHSLPLTINRWVCVGKLRIEMLCDMNFYARMSFINLI